MLSGRRKAKCASRQSVGTMRGCLPETRCSRSTGVDGSLHVARKDRHPDEWDRPVEAYDPCGPGVEELEPVTDHSDDVTDHSDDATAP
jgi:hypothetical protein